VPASIEPAGCAWVVVTVVDPSADVVVPVGTAGVAVVLGVVVGVVVVAGAAGAAAAGVAVG